MTKYIAPRNIVVYADDDQDDVDLVEEAFRQYANNVEVVTFPDGSQAVSYLQNLSDEDPLPCLIIFDINMPVLSGKEALVHLRRMQKYDNVPVVLFTTSSMPLDRNFARHYGAGFVTKPLGFEQMEIITHQFIDHCAEDIQKKLRR